MPLRFPRPLVVGDLIAITAPSAGVAPALHPRLDLAIAALQGRGYRVVEGNCLRASHQHASSGKAAQAAELMSFLQDPSVAAVMPPWGGERAIELLPLLDFSALAAIEPKWFVGFSDLSTLQLPLACLSGWASLHGPNLMELGATTLDQTTAALWQVLETPPVNTVVQSPARLHRKQRADWASEPAANLLLTEPTRTWRLDGNSSPLELHGRLIGGCLDTIARLAGTRYGDVPAFVASSVDGTLLFLENCEMAPCELLRTLSSLRLHGWFDGLAGVLIGRSAAPDVVSGEGLGYIDALRAILNELPCPVLCGLDIGHIPPQWSLVQGALAQVVFDGEQATLTMTLS
ncbi:S66 family peptidase [Chitinimonas lacunae]|uniref:S66 peptidase family protein n=1 Tax=Chitinimonas lacunae TaxID=1963018 RepID=A0ABV8MNV1_9NEIS